MHFKIMYIGIVKGRGVAQNYNRESERSKGA